MAKAKSATVSAEAEHPVEIVKEVCCEHHAMPADAVAEIGDLNDRSWHFTSPAVAGVLGIIGGLLIIGAILVFIGGILNRYPMEYGGMAAGGMLVHSVLFFALRRIVISTAESAHNSRNIFRLMGVWSDKPEHRTRRAAAAKD